MLSQFLRFIHVAFIFPVRKFFNLPFLGQDELFRSKYVGECMVDIECPADCSCDGTTVDCSGRNLKEIPRDIPLYTTEL